MTDTDQDLLLEPDDVSDTEAEYDDDPDFVPRPPRRLAGATIALIGCAAVGAGFLGGVLTQKHHDSGLTASGSAASLRTALGGAARAGGFTGGEFGGFGGAGTGAGTGGGAGTGAGTAAGTGAATSSAAVPSVIGTLTSMTPTSAVVTNLGGTKVTVTLSKTTTVTAPLSSPSLKAGEQVSVYGTKAANGTITATSVTVR